MPYFELNQKQVYYEVHGEGQPLLILNGIMMSTQSWHRFLEPLTKHNQLILLDMLDQGATDAMDGEYKHDVQVECVYGLLKHLELEQVDLFGISYGGEIALQFALDYPDYVNKLLLFNTTAWTSPWLEEVGHAWNFASGHWESYYATTIPVIYSPHFYVNNIEWITQRKAQLKEVFSNPDFIQRMIRLTNSSIGYDVRDRINQIDHPTLIVSSEYDFVTPKNEQASLHQAIQSSEWVTIPNVGHASMYESPEVFLSLVLGFILQ